MALQLREVTEDNYHEFVDLEVKPDQKNNFYFKSVKPNAMTLAQAYIYPDRKVMAVYDDETMIGSVFYTPKAETDEGDTIAWLTRLMLDQRYLGKGLGRKTMELLIEKIKEEYGDNKFRLGLSYEPHNKVAEKMYTGMGFKPSGEIGRGQMGAGCDLGKRGGGIGCVCS